MIQLATSWDNVAIMVTDKNLLYQDAVYVEPPNKRYFFSMKEARDFASELASERWKIFLLSTGNYGGDFQPLTPKMPSLEWKTYP